MKKNQHYHQLVHSIVIISCFFLFFKSSLVNAQTYDPEQWIVQPWVTQSTLDKGLIGGEGGQWGIGLAMDETDGNLMFFTTDVGGIWRSLNGGNTWEPANGGLWSRGASAVAIDPNNINRVLTVGGNGGQGFQNQHGIYLSANKGNSWSLRLPLSSYCGFRDIKEHITFDKSSLNPSLGYSTVAYWSRSDNGGNCQGGIGPFNFPGLYKSINGGTDWIKIPNSDSVGGGVVKVNPANSAVYVANRRGFYKSINGGTDFTKVLTANIVDMSYPSQNNTNNIYLLTKEGVYLSSNGGDNFQLITSNNFPGQFTPYHLNVSPVNPLKMILQIKRTTFDDVRYYTIDGGLNWQVAVIDKVTENFTPFNNGVTIYSVWHPTRENEVWTFGSGIVLKSTDGGRNFGWAGNGISHTFVSEGINWSTTHPGVLATPTQDWNSAVTTDGGRTWKYLPVSGLSYGYNYGAYSSNGQVIVVGNALENYLPSKIAVSRNGGQSFTRTAYTITGKKTGYGDPHDSTILFLGNFRSIDEGITWNNMSGCDGVITSSPTGAKELYGIKGRNIVRSDTRGASWTTVTTIPDGIQDLAYDHIRNRFYVTCGDNNFFQYDVNPRRLTNLNSRIPADQFGLKRYNAIAVDPIDPTIVYFGAHRDIYATDVSLLRSLNAGLTWQILTVAPRHNNSQYGVTGGYETQVIRVNPVTRSLYVGTNCFGNWKFGPPAVRLPSTENKPDLVVADISYSKLRPAQGDTIQFIVTLANRGSAPSSGPVSVDVKVDSVNFATLTTAGSIQPGDSVTLVTTGTPWTSLSGSHTFLAVVDPLDAEPEQSELNNSNATSAKVITLTALLPPVNLQLLLAEATNAVLTWEKPDSAIVERYDIYRDSASVGSVGSNVTRFISTGLTRNTTYRFYVKAVYESGDDTASNTVVARTAASLYAIAERTNTPVVLDGVLNENWRFSNVLSRIPTSGQTTDNFTTFALLWDSANLYVAARVLDTTLTSRPSHAAGDGLDVFVDGNRSKAIAIYTQDWALRSALNTDSLAPILAPINARARFTSSRTTAIPGGYITEFALPWRYLFNNSDPNATSGSPITFNNGKIFGFDLVNRDNDNGTGLRASVTWRSGTDREFNEASWGDAILAPAGGDLTPPAAPANLRSDRLSSTSLRLLWNAAIDDVGVAEYRVYRNGVLLAGSITTTNYTVKGLTPLTAYQFTVDAIDISGRISPVSTVLNVTTTDHLLANAIRTTVRPVVDGALNEPEWQLSYTAEKLLFGTQNNTTVFGTLWTSDTLYIGVQVLDANRFTNPAQFFNTDAVEIYLDGNQGRTASYDANDRQFIQVYNGGLFGSNQTGVRSRWSPIEGGYTVEMAVPWSNFGVTAINNLIIGFDVANNDDDNGSGRTVQTMWNGNDNNFLTSAAFGRLKLLPASNTTVTLTSLCSNNPAVTRRWRVRSTYTTPVNFTWDIYGSAQTGSGTVPANGTVIFETNTEGDSLATNTLRLNYLNKSTTKASSGAICSTGSREATIAETVTASAQGTITVFPNASDGNFTIRYPAQNAEKVEVQIINELGQSVLRQVFNVSGGTNQLPVRFRPLASGIHLLRIVPASGKQTVIKLLFNK